MFFHLGLKFEFSLDNLLGSLSFTLELIHTCVCPLSEMKRPPLNSNVSRLLAHGFVHWLGQERERVFVFVIILASKKRHMLVENLWKHNNGDLAHCLF